MVKLFNLGCLSWVVGLVVSLVVLGIGWGDWWDSDFIPFALLAGFLALIAMALFYAPGLLVLRNSVGPRTWLPYVLTGSLLGVIPAFLVAYVFAEAKIRAVPSTETFIFLSFFLGFGIPFGYGYYRIFARRSN